MKFQTLFLMLFFIGFWGVEQLMENPVLPAKIEFGRGPNCDGRGTCSVTGVDSSAANAFFFFDDQGRLQMELKKGAFPKEQLEQQFENKTFQVPEAVLLEQGLMQKLQKDTSYTIPAGVYPVVEDSVRVLVIFE